MATLRQVFGDIADAIREKGVSGTFKPIEMAEKIGEIQTGGGEDYAPIKFTALYDSTILRIHYGTNSPSVYLEYSYDGVNWQEYPQPASWSSYGGNYPDIQINQGQSIFFRSQ